MVGFDIPRNRMPFKIGDRVFIPNDARELTVFKILSDKEVECTWTSGGVQQWDTFKVASLQLVTPRDRRQD